MYKQHGKDGPPPGTPVPGVVRVRLRTQALRHLRNLDARANLRSGRRAELAALAQVLTVRRWFTRAEAELDARLLRYGPAYEELRPDAAAPDLNDWFLVHLPPGVSVAEAANVLSDLPFIDRVLGLTTPPLQPSDDMRPEQLHVQPGPPGCGAASLRGWPESLGRHRRLGVVERGGRASHEELQPLGSRLQFDGTLPSHLYVHSHANATLGLLVASLAGQGIDGLVQGAQLTVCPPDATAVSGAWTFNVADGIERASAAVGPGGIVLVEESDGIGMPIETEPDALDAVLAVVADGIHVVLPAGNGDHDLTGSSLDRGTLDSGAIVVGQAHAPGQPLVTPHSWRGGTRGNRVDLHAQGEQVRTLAYTQGSMVLAADRYWTSDDAAYTQSYGGTSAASAIIAGVAALAAELWERLLGSEPTPAQLRDLLVAHSHPQQGNAATHPIGPQPDLVLVLDALRQQAVGGLAAVQGPAPPAPTATQQEALECLATGLTYAEGGVALGIGTSTFSSRVGRLYKRLGVHSKSEAMHMGLSHGFL